MLLLPVELELLEKKTRRPTGTEFWNMAQHIAEDGIMYVFYRRRKFGDADRRAGGHAEQEAGCSNEAEGARHC